MKTIPEIIELCLLFAEKEMYEYYNIRIFNIALGKRKEDTEKYAVRIISAFSAADMIYRGIS